MEHEFDLVVIGGGAAGLCAAVRVKQRLPDARVALLEGLDRVGRKLSLTGNGRCNITNRDLSLDRYHGADPAFALPALSAYDRETTAAWFADLGVEFTYLPDGRGYPNSYQASSVVDALRFRAEECGVTLFCGQKVTALERGGDGFTVTASDRFSARAVLLATGLYAGGERLGCDASGLRLAERLGHRTRPAYPAIVQLRTETEPIRALKGVKVDAAVSVFADGKRLRTETGEVLFCDYGLSGPPVLQLSRIVSTRPRPCEVRLNFFPDCTADALRDRLFRRAQNLGRRPLLEYFTGLLQKRVGQALLKACGFPLGAPAARLTREDCAALARLAQNFSLQTKGVREFSQAQVSTGGLDTRDLFPETMASRLIPGLYFAGELIDIDGDCGGFNLQWAWSSALCAADAIGDFLRRGSA